MKLLKDIHQGTQEWLNVRLSHFTASEAPIMMGVSKYMSRDDLLTYKLTGEQEEITPAKQRIFDKGHATEALARPLVEQDIKEELYPVTASLDVDGLPLLASFDGLTMLDDTAFEHKLYNESLAAIVRTGEVPESHYWQLEHQLLVSNANSVLFVVSDGTKDNWAQCWYESKLERRLALIAGWKQFQEDLKTHKPVVIKKVQAELTEGLPAINFKLNGLAVQSNIEDYKAAATQLVEDSKTELNTDQDFANREALCKQFKAAEGKIKTVTEQLLQQTGDINAFVTGLKDISDLLRKARLNGEKAVKSRKEQIKVDMINKAKVEISDHVSALIADLDGAYFTIDADFHSAIKGKKTTKSLHESINNELANAKIKANDKALKIKASLKVFNSLTADNATLFNDKVNLVTQFEADHLELIIKERLAQHKAEVEAKLQAEQVEQATQKLVESPLVPSIKPHIKLSTNDNKMSASRQITDAMIAKAGLSPEQAIAVIKAITEGQIPYVTVNYSVSHKAA